MARTIEEQIKSKCKHFNGLMEKTCRKGINYEDVREKDARPYKFPCLLGIGMTGGKCAFSEFPTEQEAKKKAQEIQESGKKTLLICMTIKDHIKKTKETSGTIECPNCKGQLTFSSASNGHARGSCKQCEVSFME